MCSTWTRLGFCTTFFPTAPLSCRETKAGKASVHFLHGRKALKVKDQVSLVICLNTTGTVKILVLMIGKSAQPLVFKQVGKPNELWVRYTNQDNGWITESVSGGLTMFWF